MNLYDEIFLRKSVRKFAMDTPLEQSFLDEMEAAIAGFAPLYPDVPVHHRYTSGAKGRFLVPAPHYLVLTGEGKPGELEAAGFLYEQLTLWLGQKGVGSVWLGGAKDDSAQPGNDLILIGFGRPAEDLHRNLGGFKRKPMEQVTNGGDAMEPVRLAPSGMNLQPWYWQVEGDATQVFQQKLKPPASLVYKHADLDMGIALCHYMLALEKQGKPFAFSRGGEAAHAPKGYTWFGTVTTA